MSDRFDFRVSASEEQVVEAFRKARYYEEYVQKFKEEISRSQFSLVISNNRTPLEIEIPFSPNLSVENYLDAAKELLGISLEWTNFTDLGTSAGPSLSVTVDRVAQPFKARIGDLKIKPGDKLEIWIKLIWQEGLKEQGVEQEKRIQIFLARRMEVGELNAEIALNPRARRDQTLSRTENIIQAMVWKSAEQLRKS